MKKTLSLITLILIYCNSAFGHEDSKPMTDRQMFILHQTLNVDQGEITKQMHEDFWNDVPSKEKVAEFMETTGIFALLAKSGLEYQMELWKSALISFQNQQVFKSEKYLNAKDSMHELLELSLTNIADENERQIVIDQNKTSMANSDNLLVSASERKNMQSIQGPIIELSEERIIFVIANLEKSFARVDKLINPKWED
tara:strand:+ start:2012 stop:2605 length:594 start_codon:yes stop_codon:yes gene_type:complete